VDQASIFTNLGEPLSLEAINEEAVDDMTVGELAFASAFFSQRLSERLAQPESLAEIATFHKATGADWSGHETQRIGEDASSREPVAPQNHVDTFPALMAIMAKQERTQEAAMTNLVRKLDVGIKSQEAYLGVPEGIRGFRETKEVLRQTLRMSGHRANRILARARYVTHTADVDRSTADTNPKLPGLAASYAAGNIPSENIDRIIQMDEDLTKYSTAVGQTPDYKDEVLQAFEPTLVEAAESVTPEEISQAKQRWLERITHHIDADGPPLSETLKKQPDNALQLRTHKDGSATASMHMDPVWTAVVKEFLNTNLNYKGNKPLLPENIENLYKAAADAKSTQQNESRGYKEPADTREEQDYDSQAFHDTASEAPAEEPPLDDPVDPETVTTKDADDGTGTKQQLYWIDKLSRPQRAGAVLLGALYAVMSMDPEEAAAKRAHGSAAKLVIVQDIETAHTTLGLPRIPEAVRRPRGPDGLAPTVIRRPNPDEPTFISNGHTGTWTPYQSEAVNIGPVHPQNARDLLCDLEIVGQIWNGQDTVLNEYRTKRLFTTAQRKAILARDKGCQAPGCTVQGTYCHCHHDKEWSNGGQTNEDNGITLCAHHHADIHNGKWSIRKIDGVTYFQPAKWVDPYQPLLRNLYWNF